MSSIDSRYPRDISLSEVTRALERLTGGPVQLRGVQQTLQAASAFVMSLTRPGANPRTHLKHLRVLDPNARRLLHNFIWLARKARDLARVSSKLPKKPGYQDYLCSKGWNPSFVRAAAGLIEQHGHRQAAHAENLAEAVKHLRYLSRPRRNSDDVRARMQRLSQLAKTTSVLEEILPRASDELDFVQSLDNAIASGQPAQLSECCAQIGRSLPNIRGRRASAASLAHQFLLENLGSNAPAYSYDDLKQECDDPASEATKLQFRLEKFDARPAYRRRLKAAPPKK